MLVGLLETAVVLILAMLQRSLLLSRSSCSTLWQSYCDQLRKRPLLTKAATGEAELQG